VGDSDILVSLYAGAYGPTLRVDTQSEAHVDLASALFASLAEGRAFDPLPVRAEERD